MEFKTQLMKLKIFSKQILKNFTTTKVETLEKELKHKNTCFESLIQDIKISNGKYSIKSRNLVKALQKSLQKYEEEDQKRKNLESKFLENIELCKEVTNQNESIKNNVKEVNTKLNVSACFINFKS